ncbi:MAG TPA: hypothetical protein VGE93_12500 [Bryobacteraceae bacterium]
MVAQRTCAFIYRALKIPPSPNNDIPQASGLKKTQGGGEARQKQ